MQDIEKAKLRVTELVRRSPGEYSVFSEELKKSDAKHHYATLIC